MNAKYLWGVLLVTLLAATAESKRVNVKAAAPADEDDAALSTQQAAIDDEQQPTPFKPVLIARRPLRPLQAEADGERQQPVVVIRQSPRTLQQRPRADQPDEEDQELASQQDTVVRQQSQRPRAQQVPVQQQLIQQRFKEPTQQQQKEPTAQTIRNYNKLNDDGSFTFGYEADDGSFKEETRGTDCVVRGKYGYVDPDGNKREFSYVQGNPCDPNAPSEDEDDDQQQQQRRPGAEKPDEEENVPANVPRPRPSAAAKKNRPTTTLFQQTFGDFEPQQAPQPSSTPPRLPGGRQQQDAPRRQPPQISPPQQPRPSSTASPSSPLPPLSFRPSVPASDDLETAIRNLPQPSAAAGKLTAGPNSPLYTTELVFDPATGQYNTVVFQQVPRQSAGINISQRLPAAPARQPQPQFQPHSPPQFTAPQPQPQFRPAFQQPQPQFQQSRPVEFDFQRPASAGFPPAPPASQQQQFLQQQQALTFQQSQNLFRQQQQKQQQQQLQQQPFQPQSSQFFPPPSQRFAPTEQPQFGKQQQQRFEPQPEAHQQQFVLVQPGRTPGQQNLAAGQIDAFLRGHNVQF